MEERLNRVVSSPRESGSAEERMLRGDLVREIAARKERGEGVKRIARELGVDRKTVKRFHTAALKAGGKDNGKPGIRPQYHANYYGGFVKDPDGNNIEAVCHQEE